MYSSNRDIEDPLLNSKFVENQKTGLYYINGRRKSNCIDIEDNDE